MTRLMAKKAAALPEAPFQRLTKLRLRKLLVPVPTASAERPREKRQGCDYPTLDEESTSCSERAKQPLRRQGASMGKAKVLGLSTNTLG